MATKSAQPTPDAGQRRALLVTVVVLVVALVIGAVYMTIQSRTLQTETPEAAFQAVFLTNGQVYFGSMQDTGGPFVQLSNVFYLQQDAEDAATEQDLALVKLGNELHGPEDTMHINRDHILFIEDLKDNSRVVQAIEGYRPQ